MKNLLSAISVVSFIAFAVLACWYFLSNSLESVPTSPSGWWWFGCLLLGAFTAELDS